MTHDARTRILLVDDDGPIRGLIRRILAPAAFELLEAESMDSALARVSSEPSPIDLLLTDVVMTGGMGPELGRRLRERWGGLPIIYMSGYDRTVVARHGVVAADAFLMKPFTAESLRAAVDDALGRPPP
jgi:DNA-binding response OmpR family regulator